MFFFPFLINDPDLNIFSADKMDTCQCGGKIRPSKKINMFLVQVLEKYQEEGIFIIYFFIGKQL